MYTRFFQVCRTYDRVCASNITLQIRLDQAKSSILE
jgi:hypothetical protein